MSGREAVGRLGAGLGSRVRGWWTRRASSWAMAESRRDRRGVPSVDPGVARAVDAAIGWLGRAQDASASQDGGVATWFSLESGWSPSYPETTGYIVPTMLDYARYRRAPEVRARARRMLDWLVAIQLPEGGYQGGLVGGQTRIPVAFNTGQVLLGLAIGAGEFGDERYLGAMRAAADWLVQVQDPDGCWRRYPSALVIPGEKVYDTHVAWALFEAARLEPGRGYAEAGLANIRWALGWQRANGWLDRCCLNDPARPLTHTLGYALRGVVEAHRYTGDPAWLRAALRTAEPLCSALREDGFLPGRLGPDWRPAAPWACLTGSAQIAICWLLLHRLGAGTRFVEAARRANGYVRRTMRMGGPPETRGAVKGSFPVDGGYHPFQYPSWACKFVADAHLLEETATTPVG